MKLLCKSKAGNICELCCELSKKKGEYIYFVQIGEVKDNKRTVKIGTTNNLKRRMGEELRQYKQDIKVLWVSSGYSRFTTLRVETKMKEIWKTISEWSYIPNDRFIIPADVKNLNITVRKDWPIEIE